jgi:L-serine dehydratase
MKFRFSNLTELLAILQAEGLSPEAYAVKREAFMSSRTEVQVLEELDLRIQVTRSALVNGVSKGQYSRSGLTTASALAFSKTPRRIVRDLFFARTVAYALAVNEVNACGGKVVSFPTAGSSGIVPGAIWAWWDSFSDPSSGKGVGYDNQDLRIPPPLELQPPYPEKLRGAFLISSLVGVLIAQSATLAGAEGGCQAECGSAGAMAAGALSYLEGLSLDRCFSAAALSLKNSLGLACDPVAGLVEVPCVKRNAFVAVQALVATELTLAGIQSLIPFDEVVWAMKTIGDAMPASIKETAEGGLALTPTALTFRDKINTLDGPIPPGPEERGIGARKEKTR